ncbi:uncharacterized protein LOC114188342 [Vigna unguiculata]|uniref:uncharacterized protein LOC114188342 n=1 Tax=Vigna unguiculata TaxID=3917 RepID=UPI001016239F|nr:uncharacterized protein LOC114188342 [Vigna unguiculata]
MTNDNDPPRTSQRSDPGWKYCHPMDESNLNTTICNYCGKVMKGGVTRAKEHLMAKKGNVAACTKTPKNVREELWKLYKEKADSSSINPRYNATNDNHESEDEVEISTASNDKGKNSGGRKGPMDMFCRNPAAAIEKRKKEKLRQANIKEACDKNLKASVHQYIARFWYQAGLSFNLVKLKSFQDMIDAIGAYGPNLPAPSYHEIRVPLLNKEVEYTEKLLQDHKLQWSKHGCSIMSDAWTDQKQRWLINFLVSSPAGTMFVKSIDGSNFVKTGEKLFQMLDSLVEEIGEENVVQVITDNGSNYVLAGKLLEEKRPHLYWTPCAAHCIDLMLEDIGKLPLIKKTIQRGISLVGFIYSHSSTLSLLRQFTNKRELVRHAVTRFATSYLSLQRLHQEKGSLRKMFTSDEWSNNKLSKEAKGREATKIVLMPSFWNQVVFTLKVMAPLVHVLRLVDGERKAAMGYIYEAMEKAKETIMKSFNNDESKYNDVFTIIDNRWTCQLHRPLHAAGHFLNPDYKRII